MASVRSVPVRSADRLRFGHAPGHLRDAFCSFVSGEDEDLVLEGFWYGDAKQAWWDRMDPVERRRWLFGRLWNCIDTLPSGVRRQVQDRLQLRDRRRGFGSYGAAVQALARHERAIQARLRALVDE